MAEILLFLLENVVYMYQNISIQIYEYQQAPQFFLLIFPAYFSSLTKENIILFVQLHTYRLWYISAKSNFPHFVARTAKVKQQQIFCPGSVLNFEMLVPLIFKHIFFSHAVNPADQLKTHISGVIAHCQSEFLTCFDIGQFPHDSNLTINIILQTLFKKNNMINSYLRFASTWSMKIYSRK